jgi:hypothetical protein
MKRLDKRCLYFCCCCFLTAADLCAVGALRTKKIDPAGNKKLSSCKLQNKQTQDAESWKH